MKKKEIIELLSIKTIRPYTLLVSDCFVCSFSKSIYAGHKICDCQVNYSIRDYFITDYIKFFKYCYYPHLHNKQDDIYKILSDEKILSQCLKNQEIYCPITAIILSDNSIKEKRRYIDILLSYGFKMTTISIMMTHLILYEKFPHGAVFFFLKIPMIYDIKFKILSCIVDLYRQEYIPW